MMNLLYIQKLMLAVFMRGWGLLAENRVNTKEGFLRKNIVSISFFQDCAIHPYT